jgi:uncharacterized protein
MSRRHPTYASSHVSAFLLILAAPASTSAQGLDFINALYTKYEYKIPMRDGVRLFTSVYVPKDTKERGAS